MNRRVISIKTIGTPSRQGGITLFISLIFLTILTLLGLAAMSSTSLEGAMATNAQDTNIAFQSAETALRQAQTYVANSVSPASGFNASCTNGLCLPSATNQPDWSRNGGVAQWGFPGTNTVIQAPGIGGTVSRPPEYIVELLPNIPPLNSSRNLSNGYTAPTANAYRITAVGWGARPSTTVMLQTTFVKQ